MPRVLEIPIATFGIVLLGPLFLLLALLIVGTSPGPVFFRQSRIGCGGGSFQILKFRTMVSGAEDLGARLTIGTNDPRVTRLGAGLRKFKLDELPQLWNVLVGDMSFVGPRPEVPEYVRLYDASQRVVLTVPPGITDPASLAFRDENELLARSDDPERYYVEQILPRKLELTMAYLEERNGWRDVSLIAQTLRRAVLRV